jgi:hypothetical protein
MARLRTPRRRRTFQIAGATGYVALIIMAHHDGGIRIARGKGIADRGGGDNKLTHGSLLRVARLERTEMKKRLLKKGTGTSRPHAIVDLSDALLGASPHFQ